MSSPLSFGGLPSFNDLSPDLQAQVMQALQLQAGGQPAAPGGLLTQPDPQTTGAIPGQGFPPVAVGEAATQRAERAMASPQDYAALNKQPSIHDLLFNGSGMGGGPNPFQPTVRGPGETDTPGHGTGSIDQRDPSFPASRAGQPDPQGAGSIGADGSRLVPLPPARPSAADLMAPPPAPPVSGMNPDRSAVPGMPGIPALPSVTAASTGNPAASNVAPVSTFDPNGLPVSGSPKPMQAPGVGGPTEGAGRVAAAAGVPAAAGQGGGQPDLMGKFLGGLNHPDFSNLMLNIGIGLLSRRGIGEGIGAGLQGYQSSRLGDVKQQLQMYQLQQQIAGQNNVRAMLKAKGVAPEVIEAAATNPAVLSNILAQQSKDPQQFEYGGDKYLGRPDQDPSMWRKLGPATGPQPGYQAAPDGNGVTYVPGGSADPKVIEAQAKAREADKTLTPLVDPDARLKAGIPAYDTRPAWVDPNSRVTFDNGPTPKITTTRNPDGSSTAREYDPATRSFREVPGGGVPGVDTTGVPPGVDPLTYRREAAKAAVSEQKAASQRSLQATAAMPILDRAERAYSALAQNGGIGPVSASGPSRMVAGAFGKQNEIDRQEYEAAAKELELQKAQISMKGQGAITDSERRLLGMTLPRLDAASPETGLNTLRGMRQQFNKAVGAEGLPSSAGRGQDQQAPAQQQRDPATRFQQLRRGGMSQADAYARLHQEGY